MKLADGSFGPLNVSSVTATPARPWKPSPPPPAPRLVADARAASSMVKVSPSAPVPGPSWAVKDAVRPALGTGVAYTAEPTWLLLLGVSDRSAPDIRAEPLNVQPPPSEGSGVPLGGFVAEPET